LIELILKDPSLISGIFWNPENLFHVSFNAESGATITDNIERPIYKIIVVYSMNKG